MKFKEIITELTGIRHLRSQKINYSNISIYMAKLGFKLAGAGAYARVYFDPSDNNRVLKLYIDPVYEVFIKYCKEHPDNPYLPKFRGNPVLLKEMPHIFSDRPRYAKMIRMEKLTPVNFEEMKTVNKLAAYAQYKIMGYRYWEDGSPLSEEEMTIRISEIPTDETLLFNTICDLASLAKQCRGHLDLHQHNVMMRGDQLVIIDPIKDIL